MRTYELLVTFTDGQEPKSFRVDGETLGQAIVNFINTPQMISAAFKSITDVTREVVKNRTTPEELVTSIMDYQLKKLRESREKALNAKIREEAANYVSLESFGNYLKRENNRGMSFYITEKQAAFLSKLLSYARVQFVIVAGVKYYPTNPTISTRAYGGFVGKKKDTSRHILKAEATNG